MSEWNERIEEELLRVLPAHADREWVEWIAGDRVAFDHPEAYDRFCAPARDLIGRGGKRWRPRMMMLIAVMLGGERSLETARKLVSVVEFPHNGSLIIDDIEDRSEYRRGSPAVHITYGVDISINAGNLLYYLPTVTIDEADIDDRTRLAVYTIYAKYLRRVHLGQGLDIVWHRELEMIPSQREYEQMCRFKTGCLAGMSAEIGAAAAGSDAHLRARVGQLAEKIGVGFQIRDDVINLERGNPGKQRGDDIVENKKSLPVIIYANDHPERRERLFSVFRAAGEHGYEHASELIGGLIDDMSAVGSIAKASDRAEELLQSALDDMEELFPPSDGRRQLETMVKSFITA